MIFVSPAVLESITPGKTNNPVTEVDHLPQSKAWYPGGKGPQIAVGRQNAELSVSVTVFLVAPCSPALPGAAARSSAMERAVGPGPAGSRRLALAAAAGSAVGLVFTRCRPALRDEFPCKGWPFL